jgi:membrane associated rhomboid family serine protease
MIPLRNDVPTKGWAWITWLLIGGNCVVFGYIARLSDPGLQQHFVNQWAVIPAHLWPNFRTEGLTLLTATFLHAGWLHLISNMVFLFIFGPAVESAMGRWRYLLFYLLIAVFANGAQAYLSPHSAVPLVGASGAIAGVLGSFFFLFPHAKVLTLIPFFIFLTIREVPAFLFLGLWFVIQAFNGTAMLSHQLITKQSLGGVAWWAHAVGFVSGLILTPMFSQKKSRSR